MAAGGATTNATGDGSPKVPGRSDRNGSRPQRRGRWNEDDGLALGRRTRLDRFVELARRYRGWSRSQFSERLGRDSSKIIPLSGNPKLDFVVGIARALDWPLGEVAEAVWPDDGGEVGVDGREADGLSSATPDRAAADPETAGDDAGCTRVDDRAGPDGGLGHGAPRPATGIGSGTEPLPTRFAELDLAACAAHRAGDAAAMIAIARRLREVAANPTERAVAANREAGGWDLRGRCVRSLEAIQAALGEPGIRPDVRLMLEANLANSHYTLWHLVEARSIATVVLDRFAEGEPKTRLERVVEAFAFYVRGSSHRRSIASERGPDDAEFLRRAVHDLERARDRYMLLAAEHLDETYEAVAHTCRGGLLECSVDLGEIAPLDAVTIVLDRLEEVADLERAPHGDWLESFGWWAIAGCNIALRHLSGPDLHRVMAVCSNKAAEIAERLGHWPIRERVFTMEYVRRSRALHETGFDSEWVLDADDVRVLAGAMGRFPAFRETGWKILEATRYAEDVE